MVEREAKPLCTPSTFLSVLVSYSFIELKAVNRNQNTEKTGTFFSEGFLLQQSKNSSVDLDGTLLLL